MQSASKILGSLSHLEYAQEQQNKNNPKGDDTVFDIS